MMLSRTLMLGGALLSAAIACTDDTSQAPPLLVVQVAVLQPATDDLGIITLIQSRGGSWLEVQLTGGTLADGTASACLPAPNNEPLSQSITSIQVFPKQREAVITVRLFPDVKSTSSDDGDAGTAGATGMAGESSSDVSRVPAFPHGACGFDVRPLRELTKPISRAAAPVIPGSGGTSNGGIGGVASGSGGSMNGGTGGAVTEGGAAGDGAAGDGAAGGSVAGAGAAGDAGQGGAP